MIQIFGHAKCKATRAAQRFFSDRGLKVQYVDVRERAPSRGELDAVAKAVGGPAALWDGSGKQARERGLQFLGPSDERVMELVLADPLLLRTPLVRLAERATVGHDEPGWRSLAADARGTGGN